MTWASWRACDRIGRMYAGRIVDIRHERLSFFYSEVKALNEYTKGLLESIPASLGRSMRNPIPLREPLVDLPNPHEGCEFALENDRKRFSKCVVKRFPLFFQDPLTSLNPYIPLAIRSWEVMQSAYRCGQEKAYARAVELLSLVGINEPEKRMKQYPHELSVV